jgi:predicted CXXCH cytochrome family protein
MSGGARRYAAWLGSAIVLSFAAIGVFILSVLVANGTLGGRSATGSAAPGASGPGPSDWMFSGPPGAVALPDGSDCTACHVNSAGVIGVKTIPVIAHPIHGWTSCTACHSDATLVKTAPGHSGIHAQECLVCHQQSTDPAPTPKHETLPDSDCLSCHNGTIAPLPSSMAGRPATLCWLCHHR